MSNMDYKGTPILFHPASAKFSAVIDGDEVFKPSVDAVKKAIDKSLASRFTPFSALIVDGYNGFRRGVRKVNIVSLHENTRSNYEDDRYRFIEEGKEKEKHAAVLKDTPDNEKLCSEIQAFDLESDRIKNERDALRNTMLAKLGWLRATTFAKQQKEKAVS